MSSDTSSLVLVESSSITRHRRQSSEPWLAGWSIRKHASTAFSHKPWPGSFPTAGEKLKRKPTGEPGGQPIPAGMTSETCGLQRESVKGVHRFMEVQREKR